MSSQFADVKPFPAQAGPGHNRAPLDESVVAEFLEGLKAEPGLMKRIEDILARAETVGPCETDETAGRYGDFIKLCRAAWERVEAEREVHNRPLLTAQRTLKARSDNYVQSLKSAASKVQGLLDEFMNKKRAEADRQRRLAEEQARAAREAAEAEARRQAEEAGTDPATDLQMMPPIVDVAPAHVEDPVVRGDYGSRVGSKTVWHHEIISVRQLPDHVLKHEKVVAAINQVLGQMVRGGARDIKGVRIWSDQTTVVR